MDGLILLREARRAGLRVTASGDRLLVQGPRRLEAVARTLLAQKRAVLEALAEEVAWRLNAMRSQVTATGAIPLLLARPGAPWEPDRCCSCGDPIGSDDRYRCPLCVEAAVAVLAELG